jgi:integrase
MVPAWYPILRWYPGGTRANHLTAVESLEVAMRKKLTKRVVDRECPGAKRKYIWDTELRGFGLVIYPNGRRMFVLRYDGPFGRRRVNVSPYPGMTVPDARERAEDLRADATKGKDPLGEKQARRAMPTAEKWFEEYLGLIAGRRKSMANDRTYFGWAKERWHGRPLDSITQRDIEAAMKGHAERRKVPAKHRHGKAPGHVATDKRKPAPEARTVGGKIGTNRWFAAIRASFEAAVRAGVIRENPARYVRKFPENPPRQRTLTDEEMGRLLAAVHTLPVIERGIFRLLIETGCRRSEALRMRWQDIDLDAGVWTLRSTKAGKVQSLPLPAITLRWLRELPRTSEWVFPSPRYSDRPWSEVRFLWDQLRKKAELLDVNIHDLRRTYGLNVAREAGILAASKLLRHSGIGITAKVYAPLGVEELRAVANSVAGHKGRVLKMRARNRG